MRKYYCCKIFLKKVNGNGGCVFLFVAFFLPFLKLQSFILTINLMEHFLNPLGFFHVFIWYTAHIWAFGKEKQNLEGDWPIKFVTVILVQGVTFATGWLAAVQCFD